MKLVITFDFAKSSHKYNAFKINILIMQKIKNIVKFHQNLFDDFQKDFYNYVL